MSMPPPPPPWHHGRLGALAILAGAVVLLLLWGLVVEAQPTSVRCVQTGAEITCQTR